jgi:hypothetical protein
MLQLAEEHRTASQAKTPRAVQSGVDLHLRGGGLQPGANAKADSNSSSGLMTP